MHYSVLTRAHIFKMIDARNSEIQRKGIQAYAESKQQLWPHLHLFASR